MARFDVALSAVRERRRAASTLKEVDATSRERGWSQPSWRNQ